MARTVSDRIWADAMTATEDDDGIERTIETSTGSVELPLMVARARAGFKRRDDRLRERYGIDPWIQCVFCEDTGRNVVRADAEDMGGGAGTPCACRMGETHAFRDLRATLWRGSVPARMRDWTLDTCPNHDLVVRLYDWTKRDPLKTGWGLVLLGETGRAKTGAAVGMLRHYHDLGHSTMVVSAEDLLSTTKDGFDDKDERVPYHQRPMMRARRVELLLLDDLGAERVTDWSSQAIDSLLRTRYDNQLPTIVTSNLHGAEFKQRVGPRLISRFQESASSVIAEGVDYRAPKAQVAA